MNKRFQPLAATLLLCGTLGFGAAWAADAEAPPKREPTPAQQAQRERMKHCNAEAKTQALKGEPRKAFMRECLSSGKKKSPAEPAATVPPQPQPPAALLDQQQQVESCQQQAASRGLSQEETKAFMSQCLS